MADARITALLAELAYGSAATLRLTIQIGTIHKRTHTTRLHVSRATKRGGGGYTIKNACIDATEGDTHISANSQEKACFDPVLYSDPTATMTDVLQVLKTRLALSVPGAPPMVSLTDAAKKDDVALTEFRLLRGGRPLYEKYGYYARTTDETIAAIAATTWGDIKDKVLASNDDVTVTFADAYRDITGTIPTDSESIQTVMSRITLEQEGAYNRALIARIRPPHFTDIGLSFRMVATILHQRRVPHSVFYRLNPVAPEWTRWSDRIRITEVALDAEPTQTAGFRHGRSLRRSQTHSSLSRVRGRGGRRVTQRRAQSARRVQ